MVARPIMATTADQAHAVLLADDHHPVAVVLDLVQPVGARGHVVRFGGERKRIQHCAGHISHYHDHFNAERPPCASQKEQRNDRFAIACYMDR
jgi:hypothetical protein